MLVIKELLNRSASIKCIKELLLMEDFTGTEDSNFGSTETFMRANLEMVIFMDKEDLFMSLEKIQLLQINTEKKWE